MKQIYDSQYGQVFQGDCLEVMKSLPENSIETCITDPPAGINFMNKKFDSSMGGFWEWVNYYKERFREVLRILKPGGMALVWAIPRTAHWTTCALMFAGFEIENKVYHLFGTGWPKGLEISKGIDKHFGCIREKIEDPEKIKNTPTKENKLFQGHDNDGLIEPNPVHPLAQQWNGWNSQLKPMCEEWIVAMKPTGKVYWHELRELTGLTHWVIQVDLDKPEQREKYGIPAEAKEAVLWKMKPLVESESFMDVIYLDGKQQEPFNIKPFKPWHSRGIIENALKWGTGGYNINECRIPVDRENEPTGPDLEPAKQNVDKVAGIMNGYNYNKPRYLAKSIQNTFQKGRYSGNVIIDDEVAEEMDVKYGERKSGKVKQAKRNNRKGNVYKEGMGIQKHYEASTGGASRFFTRCNFTETDFFFSGKATPGEKNAGVEGKCDHPTVKPLELMRWICRLSKTPTGGTVIDPFAGTFSTAIAAYLEGRKFIAIEQDPEYIKIGMSRLKHAMGLFFKEVKK